ncbi:unnamed protein product, partial [marine sediment metagenome]
MAQFNVADIPGQFQQGRQFAQQNQQFAQQQQAAEQQQAQNQFLAAQQQKMAPLQLQQAEQQVARGQQAIDKENNLIGLTARVNTASMLANAPQDRWSSIIASQISKRTPDAEGLMEVQKLIDNNQLDQVDAMIGNVLQEGANQGLYKPAPAQSPFQKGDKGMVFNPNTG